MSVTYFSAIAMGILAIATIAYAIVTFLLLKSYRNQTKILQQQLINQTEQNEIMKAQTTALQLQVKNLEAQNNLLEKELKVSAIEKVHFLEKFRDEQMKRYENLKTMAEPKFIPFLDRLRDQTCEYIIQEIEEIKRIQRELGE